MYFDSHHRAEPLVHAPTVATAHAAAHGATAVATAAHGVSAHAAHVVTTAHGASAHATHGATAHGATAHGTTATTVAVLSHKVAKEAHQHVRLAAAITKGTAAHSTLAVTVLIHDLSKDLGINQLQHTFFPILSI